MNESNQPKEIHPAALLFPMLPENELQELADDIKAKGLLKPILTLDGKILDGRNRLKACEMAGVEPRFDKADLNGSYAAEFVVSMNIRRRHLDVGQRTAIGVDMLPLLQEEAEQRRREGERRGGLTAGNGRPSSSPPHAADSYNPHKVQGEARQIAAKTVQVGKTKIQEAAAVKKADPNEFERIRRGEVSVNAAYKKVMAAEPKKLPSAKPGTAYQERRSKAAKRRMIDGLSSIRGFCRGLAEVDIPLLLLGLTAKERKDFQAMAFESARTLRVFGQNLGGAQ